MSRSESPQSRQDQSWSAYVATWTDPVPGEAAGDGPIWDDEETYFPLFCLTEVPADYFDEVNHFCTGRASWLAISSSTPSFPRVVSEIKSHMDEQNPDPVPTPFLDSTIPQVYAFFKKYLRRPDDKDYGLHSFTHFTFLAVDVECVQPTSPLPAIPEGSPWRTDSSYTILVCSDAPDWHENGTQARLKTQRLPMAAAMEFLDGLEDLTVTPSEVHSCVFDNPNAPVLKLFPPPPLLPTPPFTMDEDQEYKPGSPAEMRQYKSNGLRMEERKERTDIVGEEE